MKYSVDVDDYYGEIKAEDDDTALYLYDSLPFNGTKVVVSSAPGRIYFAIVRPDV